MTSPNEGHTAHEVGENQSLDKPQTWSPSDESPVPKRKLGNDKAESPVWSGFQPWFRGRWPFSRCKMAPRQAHGSNALAKRRLPRIPAPLPRLSVRGDRWMSCLVRVTTDDNGTLRYIEGRPLPTTSTRAVPSIWGISTRPQEGRDVVECARDEARIGQGRSERAPFQQTGRSGEPPLLRTQWTCPHNLEVL